MLPIIFGLAGAELTDGERALFRDSDPAGYILFARNCVDPVQLRALTDDLRELSGRERLPILIDQEGGRVARMRPPHWPLFPEAGSFGRLYERAPLSAIEAAYANAMALGLMLRAAGITVDCLPVLDVLAPDCHDVIGSRSYGDEPMRVAALGAATLDGLRDAGVVGVVKHIPGHGRARADSHVELPVVECAREELERDFEPFRRLAAAPMAMTAHVVYQALDADRCASLSPVVIADVIRGEIGYDGLLMSDDLGMSALSGDVVERAIGVLEAGCDVALHCSGDFAEMEALAGAVGTIGEQALARLERAMAWAEAKPSSNATELAAKRDALLAVL